MAVDYSPVAMATEMMQSALVLLDAAGEDDAVVNLQHALSIVRREPVAQTIEQASAALETPEARAILERLAAGVAPARR